MFAGKREAVELPPKRGPGRPSKVRKKEEEEDEVLEALQSRPDGHEAYDEQLRSRRKRKVGVRQWRLWRRLLGRGSRS